MPNVPRFIPPRSVYDRLCGILALIMLICVCGGQIGGQHWPQLVALNWVAAICAVTLAVLRLPNVRPIAKVFVGLAIAAAAGVLLFAPQNANQLDRALQQGTAFSTFLTTLGLVRGPVRASRLVATAAAYLFSFPAKFRTAAVTYGSQFLTILFNLGTISMMADIAKNHAEGRDSGADPKAITLAALRGTLLATAWNPIGIGYAVVLAAISGADPALLLAITFGSTLLLTALGLRVAKIQDDSIATPAEAAPVAGGGWAVIGLLAAVAGLIAATLALHWVLHISFLVAACIVLPAMSLIWPLVEPSARAGAPLNPVAAMGDASASTASEATVFLSAALISVPAALLLHSIGLENLFESPAVPQLVFILGCMLLIPLLAAVYVPHTISFVIITQVVGASSVGAAHPLSLGLALMFAWAMAISISPISAMSLIAGNSIGRSAFDVSLKINRTFTLVTLCGATILVSLLYLLE
ncbi:hypothetical protein BVG79_00993 [Ketogulonicigenium robustum]|uniref:Uncharacterized protein n=1 Tax=Ketogulonicigenium robustum TaxID=92947 RepID=A0A1W6NYS3_9RHOB|nr:hypothetical protein [Ketogulonicigenium robustum]ARO14339.1 hypothetical protein BVG79_00993 [Ketogulonicigenium robustum]